MVLKHESDYRENNAHIRRFSDTLSVTLTYPPRNDSEPEKLRFIEVDQESVRATDGIRLHYDYERDGWVVSQASVFSWDEGDEKCDPDWQEVAFVQSWAREKAETPAA